MCILSLFRKNRKPLDARSCAVVYGIPLDLAKIILSFKKHGDNIWDNLGDPTTEHDYNMLLEGASIAYNEQQLMGCRLPDDDERVKQLHECMRKLGVAVQFHPYYGMQIVDVEYRKRSLDPNEIADELFKPKYDAYVSEF